MKFSTVAILTSLALTASATPLDWRPANVRPSTVRPPSGSVARRDDYQPLGDYAAQMRTMLEAARHHKSKRQTEEEPTPAIDPEAIPTVAPTDEEELAQLLFKIVNGHPEDVDLTTLPKRYTEVDPATVPVDLPIEVPSVDDEELAYYLFRKGVEAEAAAGIAKRDTPTTTDEGDLALFYYEKGVEAISAIEKQEEPAALERRQEEEATAPPQETVVVPSVLPTDEEETVSQLMFEWSKAVEDGAPMVVPGAEEGGA